MISIIICSSKPSFLEELKKNIQRTIGIIFEIISIDNSGNSYSISEAYNIGIDKARFEFLLFLHEDIFFHSDNWGKCVVDLFLKSKDIGLIGVAGAKFKTRAPSLWTNVSRNNWVMYLNQRLPDGSITLNSSEWTSGQKIDEVKVIDGVFMATRKNINFRFDEKMPGFHCYDTYLSMIVSISGLRTVVTNQVLIEHFSNGKQDKEWVKAASYFHQKYKQHLPLGNLPSMQQAKREDENSAIFIKLCIFYELKYLAFIYWLNLFFRAPFYKMNIFLLKEILI